MLPKWVNKFANTCIRKVLTNSIPVARGVQRLYVAGYAI